MVGGSPRDLTLIVKDDAYVATQTIEFVDELIEAENVFSILTLGSPNTLAVYDKINEECIPHPFVMTGHPAWGDPVNHPWTTIMQMSYSTEAILWGAWIRENLSELLPVKVAGLVMDNDFGRSYERAFEEWAEAHPEVVSKRRGAAHCCRPSGRSDQDQLHLGCAVDRRLSPDDPRRHHHPVQRQC